MLNEFLRHPVLAARLISRRLKDISSSGLPNFSAHKHDDFDRRYGVETATFVRIISTDSPNRSHGRKYEPAAESAIRWCIESCKLCHDETTFIDIGCGKGRALIVAGMYPFRRIIGVEYSPQLAKICRRNLEKVELVDRCEVIIADAADFRFPAGNLLVFIYNPFDSVILTRVLQNVASSRDEVFLGQLGPGHDVIQRSGIAKVVCSGEGAILYEIAKAQGPEES